MKIRVQALHLVNPAPMGTSAVVERYLSERMTVDGKAISMSFDKDPRFLRVEIKGSEYSQLIPLANIAMILVRESE